MSIKKLLWLLFALASLYSMIGCNKPLTCDAPVNLQATHIARNGATFTWDQQNPGEGYWWKVIRVSDNKEMIRNVGDDTWDLVNGHFEVYIYALQGEIQPNTVYRLEMAHLCTNTDISAFSSVTFTTTN